MRKGEWIGFWLIIPLIALSIAIGFISGAIHHHSPATTSPAEGGSAKSQ